MFLSVKILQACFVFLNICLSLQYYAPQYPYHGFAYHGRPSLHKGCTSNLPGQCGGSSTYFDRQHNSLRPLKGGGTPVLVDHSKRCSGGFLGVKQHPQQPQYYYVCLEDSVVFAKCGNLEFFNATSLSCQPYMFLSYFDPVCTHEGRHPIAYDGSYYYRCNGNMEPRIFSCPSLQTFSPFLNTCIPNMVNVPTLIAENSVSLPKYCEEKFPACKINGTFSSPYDCSFYYTCDLKKNHIFLQTRYKCPEGSCFDARTKACECTKREEPTTTTIKQELPSLTLDSIPTKLSKQPVETTIRTTQTTLDTTTATLTTETTTTDPTTRESTSTTSTMANTETTMTNAPTTSIGTTWTMANTETTTTDATTKESIGTTSTMANTETTTTDATTKESISTTSTMANTETTMTNAPTTESIGTTSTISPTTTEITITDPTTTDQISTEFPTSTDTTIIATATDSFSTNNPSTTLGIETTSEVTTSAAETTTIINTPCISDKNNNCALDSLSQTRDTVTTNIPTDFDNMNNNELQQDSFTTTTLSAQTTPVPQLRSIFIRNTTPLNNSDNSLPSPFNIQTNENKLRIRKNCNTQKSQDNKPVDNNENTELGCDEGPVDQMQVLVFKWPLDIEIKDCTNDDCKKNMFAFFSNDEKAVGVNWSPV